MKYLLLFLTCCSLWADNQVRLWVGCRVEVNVDPKLVITFYPFNLEQPDFPANIVITSKPVIKTSADLAKLDYVDASFTITAIPNKESLEGYTLAVNLLTMYIELNVQSPIFETFRLFPLTGDRSSILNGNFVDTKIWFQRVTSETFSTGVQIAHTWTSDNAIISNQSTEKSVSFTLRFSTANINFIDPGVYWMQMNLGMDSYTATADQDLTIASEIVTQINVLQAYINQIDGYLADKNTLFTLSDTQIAALNKNKIDLQKQLLEIIKTNSNLIPN